MQLMTFVRPDGQISWGVRLEQGRVLDIPGADPTAPTSMLEHIVGGGTYDIASLLNRASELGECIHAESDLAAKAPFRPGKIIGVGLNYVEHVEESSRSLDTSTDLPTRPVLFGAPGTAVVGPGEPIRHNADLTQQLDWECELAVVIGRETTPDVTEADALDHVFGYSIINDISARDQRRSGQWFFSKGQDSYKPFGPVLVTADELEDPHALALRLDVNGDERQNGHTSQMLFKIHKLIADISSGMTLEPGDVIATGSPQGVGAAMNPPQFLQPGDVVNATIEGIGTLSNPVEDVRP